MEYIKQLEERIKKLEDFIATIKITDETTIRIEGANGINVTAQPGSQFYVEGSDLLFQNCMPGEINIEDGCEVTFDKCDAGAIITTDIEDAESKVDDLEGRLEDIIARIDETNKK